MSIKQIELSEVIEKLDEEYGEALDQFDENVTDIIKNYETNDYDNAQDLYSDVSDDIKVKIAEYEQFRADHEEEMREEFEGIIEDGEWEREIDKVIEGKYDSDEN